MVLNTLSMKQELNEIVCFTVKQEELTKEVTAAFERGSYSRQHLAAIQIS